MKPENGNKDRILELLEENPHGLTIKEAAEELDMNRVTVSKYLSILAAEEKARVREVGNAKLHYPEDVEVDGG